LLPSAQAKFRTVVTERCGRDPLYEGEMNRRDLSRLKTLQHEEPAKLSKLVRLLWPDIRAAISRGHTLKVIRNRLEEIGISIGYRQLVVYVSRLRREDASRITETAAGTEKNGSRVEP